MALKALRERSVIQRSTADTPKTSPNKDTCVGIKYQVQIKILIAEAEVQDLFKNVAGLKVAKQQRGDYTGSSSAIIQRHMTSNNLSAFSSVRSDRTKWLKVPEDRFNKCVDYLR